MPVQEMENKSSEVQIIEFHFKFFLENFFSPQQEMTKIEKKETKKTRLLFFIKFEMMRRVSPNRFVEIKNFRNIFFRMKYLKLTREKMANDKWGISYKSQNIVNQKSRKKKKK